MKEVKLSFLLLVMVVAKDHEVRVFGKESRVAGHMPVARQQTLSKYPFSGM